MLKQIFLSFVLIINKKNAEKTVTINEIVGKPLKLEKFIQRRLKLRKLGEKSHTNL